jgi:hypothetical protein
MQAGPTVTQHAILYRSGRDSRVNRANITTLKRVVSKSTTPVSLEIYYHEPLKLLDWAEPHERVRYVKLRSGEDFPVAERMAQQMTDRLLIFDDTLLISAADVWLLMGLSATNAVSALRLSRSVTGEGETPLSMCFREARLCLVNYLYPQGDFNRHAFAINKNLLLAQRPVQPGGLGEKLTYHALLRSLSAFQPKGQAAHSVAVRHGEEYPLLNAGARTVEAFSHWKQHKIFPWWFSARAPLFHVAQLAAYYGALVSFISPASGLIVFLFALLITPQYFFARLQWRQWKTLPLRLLTRFALYFAG